MNKGRLSRHVAEMHGALVTETAGLRVSSSRGKNNFRGVKKKSRFPRKDCTCKTMPRPTAEFRPSKNDNCA
jgi:hypothetical protein